MYYDLLFVAEAFTLLLGVMAIWSTLRPRISSKLKSRQKTPRFAVPAEASQAAPNREPAERPAIAVLSVTGANKTVSEIVCRVQHKRERRTAVSRK